MKYFKGDALEIKMDACGSPKMTSLSADKDAFFSGSYACFILGELLYDTNRAPLANAIDRAIFRELFATIFNAFVSSGSLESYLTVFRNIFGSDVTVTFTVPAAGKLAISVLPVGLIQNTLLARTVGSSTYVYDEILTHDGDNLMSRNPKGFQTQYQAQQMLFEMVPGGIYTTVTLTI
jgi:hypothetical protein